MRGDAKTEGCDVPVFQLLQWKHAIRMEAKCAMRGWRPPFRRSVWAHAKRKLGIKGSRAKVIDHIQGLLTQYEKEVLARQPAVGPIQ